MWCKRNSPGRLISAYLNESTKGGENLRIIKLFPLDLIFCLIFPVAIWRSLHHSFFITAAAPWLRSSVPPRLCWRTVHHSTNSKRKLPFLCSFLLHLLPKLKWFQVFSVRGPIETMPKMPQEGNLSWLDSPWIRTGFSPPILDAGEIIHYLGMSVEGQKTPSCELP
mgnify:CR=1 FL=1